MWVDNTGTVSAQKSDLAGTIYSTCSIIKIGKNSLLPASYEGLQRVINKVWVKTEIIHIDSDFFSNFLLLNMILRNIETMKNYDIISNTSPLNKHGNDNKYHT